MAVELRSAGADPRSYAWVGGRLAPATGAFVIALAATVLGLFALSRVLGAPDEAVVRRRTLSWTVGTFVFHVAAGLVVWNVASLTKYLGPDALSYQANATAILQHWTSGTLLPSSLAAGKNGFSYMLAGLYRIGQPFRYRHRRQCRVRGCLDPCSLRRDSAPVWY